MVCKLRMMARTVNAKGTSMVHLSTYSKSALNLTEMLSSNIWPSPDLTNFPRLYHQVKNSTVVK